MIFMQNNRKYKENRINLILNRKGKSKSNNKLQNYRFSKKIVNYFDKIIT